MSLFIDIIQATLLCFMYACWCKTWNLLLHHMALHEYIGILRITVTCHFCTLPIYCKCNLANDRVLLNGLYLYNSVACVDYACVLYWVLSKFSLLPTSVRQWMPTFRPAALAFLYYSTIPPCILYAHTIIMIAVAVRSRLGSSDLLFLYSYSCFTKSHTYVHYMPLCISYRLSWPGEIWFYKKGWGNHLNWSPGGKGAFWNVYDPHTRKAGMGSKSLRVDVHGTEYGTGQPTLSRKPLARPVPIYIYTPLLELLHSIAMYVYMLCACTSKISYRVCCPLDRKKSFAVRCAVHIVETSPSCRSPRSCWVYHPQGVEPSSSTIH